MADINKPSTGKSEGTNDDDKQPKKRRKIDVSDDVNTLPRIPIYGTGAMHEVALPLGVEYPTLRPVQGPPARGYFFELDFFQKEAILCVENEQSVFVSAHTSAGKTIIVEYTIALCLRNKKRAIYTTTTKALSNKKYRELSEEFHDIGLLTGDETVNPTANCLAMTIEMFRDALYRGSDLTKEVNWVIFDEIHYMRDKKLGVMWEEIIVLLPDTVHYVFLSDTISNATQFARWICHVHHQACHVVQTDYRPVPLEHYIYPFGANNLYLIADKSGDFHENSVFVAMRPLSNRNATSGTPVSNDFENCRKVLKIIMKRNFAPVIVFNSNKIECETYAVAMKTLDFNTEVEKKNVSSIFDNAIAMLSEEDKQFPQLSALFPLLLNGIGVHHSGLLPVLKEIVEILFAKGLIKVLFVTKAFAMGLNMPARTVLFTSNYRPDGKGYRYITSGEYSQMSGRAGRRGKDEKGNVILMIQEKLLPCIARNIVKGKPNPINSSFHFTYNMILNLLCVDHINPQNMLRKSFLQFQSYDSLPALYKKLEKLNDKLNMIHIDNEEEVTTYCGIQEYLAPVYEYIQACIVRSRDFVQAGHLVTFHTEAYGLRWGLIIHREEKELWQTQIIKVLFQISKPSVEGPHQTVAKPPEEKSEEMMVVPVKLESLHKLSSIKVVSLNDLTEQDALKRAESEIQRIATEFPDGLSSLSSILDIDIHDSKLVHSVKAKSAFEYSLHKHPLHKHYDLNRLQALFSKKTEIRAEIKEVEGQIENAKFLPQMLEELECRKRVLQRLKFCTPADVIELKGRVACEIGSADALLLTELIFTHPIQDFNSNELAALLSCFVFQMKYFKTILLTPKLYSLLTLIQAGARRIVSLSKESNLKVDRKSYVESFKPHLMGTVEAWSEGRSFAYARDATDVFQGSIILCLRRLVGLLHRLCQASKLLDDDELEQLFSETIQRIKRGVFFVPSLYISCLSLDW